MKLMKAKGYRKLVAKETPQFKPFMRKLSLLISTASCAGYTMTLIEVRKVLGSLGLDLEEDKEGTFRNLVLHELSDKGFSYKITDNRDIIIYW